MHAPASAPHPLPCGPHQPTPAGRTSPSLPPACPSLPPPLPPAPCPAPRCVFTTSTPCTQTSAKITSGTRAGTRDTTTARRWDDAGAQSARGCAAAAPIGRAVAIGLHRLSAGPGLDCTGCRERASADVVAAGAGLRQLLRTRPLAKLTAGAARPAPGRRLVHQSYPCAPRLAASPGQEQSARLGIHRFSPQPPALDQVSENAKEDALANWVCKYPSNASAARQPQLPATLREAALRVSRRDPPEPRGGLSDSEGSEGGGCWWRRYDDRGEPRW